MEPPPEKRREEDKDSLEGHVVKGEAAAAFISLWILSSDTGSTGKLPGTDVPYIKYKCCINTNSLWHIFNFNAANYFMCSCVCVCGHQSDHVRKEKAAAHQGTPQHDGMPRMFVSRTSRGAV